ncbi:MAG: hypothetical protein JW882_14345 [Deltaproteobacteria bacterium]|nr:hypothetical protein [Deltaproteobacteria bacterium]
MSNISQILTLIIIFLMFLVLSKKILTRQMIKAFQFIVNDLRKKGALDPESAVELHYAKSRIIKFGLRDYRPKILIQLVQSQIIGITEEGKYFLNESKLPPQYQISPADPQKIPEDIHS